jgi:hypothetical protein
MLPIRARNAVGIVAEFVLHLPKSSSKQYRISLAVRNGPGGWDLNPRPQPALPSFNLKVRDIEQNNSSNPTRSPLVNIALYLVMPEK